MWDHQSVDTFSYEKSSTDNRNFETEWLSYIFPENTNATNGKRWLMVPQSIDWSLRIRLAIVWRWLVILTIVLG